MSSAETELIHVADLSVSVMPCLPVNTLLLRTFSRTSTICSGQLHLVTPCGIQRTMTASAHQVVAELTNQSAAEVQLGHSSFTMPSPSNVVPTELSSHKTSNAKNFESK